MSLVLSPAPCEFDRSVSFLVTLSDSPGAQSRAPVHELAGVLIFAPTVYRETK
jgi:hypothetical protein